jgi:hypothetical protein
LKQITKLKEFPIECQIVKQTNKIKRGKKMSKDLKIVIKGEFDESLTTEQINNKIRELEKKISLTEIKYPEEITGILEQFSRIQKQVNNNPSKFGESLKIAFSRFDFRFSYSLPLVLNQLYISYNTLINKELKKRIDTYEQFLKLFDKNLWTIDVKLLSRIEQGEIKIDNIEAYIENELHSYLDYFKSEELYSNYKLIIEQSYSSFRKEHYALAIFPLFSVVDNLIKNTFDNYEIDTKIKAHLLEKKDKDFFKFKDYIESTQDELAIYLMFFRRVFNMYKIIFNPSWYNYPSTINRNWIMHGSYKYDTVSKKDVLKMYQLIKAIDVIKNISFNKE